MRKILGFIFCLLALQSVYAQVAERPSPLRLYNNLSAAYPDFLSADEARKLEDKLEQFSNETSNQICVVIVDHLNGLSSEQYATGLGNAWGVGKKGANNGIVILIKPTSDDGGHDDFIAVGYGLEGAVPDLATKRVRDEELEQNLKAGQFYTALDRSTDKLMKLAKSEIDVKDYTRTGDGANDDDAVMNFVTNHPILLILLIMVGAVIMVMFGGGNGGSGFGSRRTTYYGGLGGGSSWGGGGSSGGGGGWGGFGGGSFGGGGSGGKW